MRLIALFPLAACAISAEKANQEFEVFLQEHQACELPGDCAVVYPGCPLGCYALVAAEHAAEAEDLAERLIDRYEAAGRACDYDCIEQPPVICDAGTCAFEE